MQFPLPISKCTCKCIVAVWNLSLFSWIEISLPSSQFVLEVEDTNVCLLDAKTSVAAGQQLGSTEIVLTDRSILGPCTWTCIRCLNFKHIATCSIDNMCLGFCFYWYKFSGYQIHSISILHWDFIYWILETIEKGLKIHFSLTKPRPEAGCPGEAQCHAVCGGPQLLGLCGPPRQEVGPGHGEGLHHSDRAVR